METVEIEDEEGEEETKDDEEEERSKLVIIIRDGRLIDAASIRQAQVMVDKFNQIEKSLAARQ